MTEMIKALYNQFSYAIKFSRIHFESVSELPVNYCAAYLLNSMGVKTNCTKPRCMFVHKAAMTMTKDEAVAFATHLSKKGRSKLGPELLSHVHDFTTRPWHSRPISARREDRS